MADVPSPDVQSTMTFAELGLPASLVDALDAQGITAPFAIQTATIPDSLSGRDVLGRGQTGSGKTLAFSLPTLARLAERQRPGRAPRAVILSPTRELAMQIADVIQPLARALGLFSVLVAGGMKYGPQLKMLERGVDIIVATPGRMIDLIERGAADLSQVEVAILDEADEMCDMGFFEEVTAIWDAVPADAQHLLFSATLDGDVEQIVSTYLHDPVEHGVDSVKATVTTMDHRIWTVHPLDKFQIASMVANRPGRTLVFVRTQMDAEKMGQYLRRHGLMAGALHGGMRQGARSRVMDAFRRGDLPILVATDVAARGIDVNDVSLVLQADIAHDAKDYLHRAGRTARAGSDGQVISFVAPRQRRRMDQISRQIGLESKNVRVRLGDETLEDYDAPTGEPIAEESYEAVLWPPRPARGRANRQRRSHREDRRPRPETSRARRERRDEDGPIIETPTTQRTPGRDLTAEIVDYDRRLTERAERQPGTDRNRRGGRDERREGERSSDRRNRRDRFSGRDEGGHRSPDSHQPRERQARDGFQDRQGYRQRGSVPNRDGYRQRDPESRGAQTRSYRDGGRERRYDDLGSDWRYSRQNRDHRDDRGDRNRVGEDRRGGWSPERETGAWGRPARRTGQGFRRGGKGYTPQSRNGRGINRGNR